MRYIDNKRRKALYDIEVRARAILTMTDAYERAYKDEKSSNGLKIESLDEIWRIITVNQVALTEILRENSL